MEGQSGLAVKQQVSGQSVLRLLLLEESASEAQSHIDLLREAGYTVTAARIKSPLEFQAALKKQEWDLIISPLSLPNFTAKQALSLLAHAKLDVPFIVISDEVADDELSEALHCGICTLIKKNQPEHLRLTVKRELRNLAHRRARHYYENMYRESERRCQSLLESSINAIACVRNGKVIYSNPVYDQLISRRKERDVKSITDLIHPDDRQRFEALVKDVETGKNLSDKAKLQILEENDKPRTAIIEAMAAHISDQQCAQVSICLNVQPDISAKQKGSASTVVPSKEDSHNQDGDAAIKQILLNALAGNRFRLVYQPIVPLHAQPTETYEVLTRMLDEQGKEIPPAQFMPAAEKAGLMNEVDRWIIHTAMQALAKQYAQKKETSFLLKLSEDSFGDSTLVPWIAERLQELHLPGDAIIFEIKEANVIPRLEEAKRLINGLKQLHCRTALGNFGSDPQSLDCLEILRVNFVKLAGSFVDKLSGDPRSQATVRAVVQTAHDLGSLTIATFVQDSSKMATLWQSNVDYIQGYFLQAPEADLSYNFSDDE